MKFSKGNLSRRHQLILAALLLTPLLVALGKCSFMPTSEWFCQIFSLENLRSTMNKRLEYVLSVPLGAILVVFCRLTLGIRILGPFRSILLAVAFQITGIMLGIAFLVVVVASIFGVRPTLKNMKLPYFARVSVILSLVSVIIIATILLGNVLDAKALLHVAFFPIFVLCLVGDGFCQICNKEGAKSALWRASMTVAVGVILTWLFRVPGLMSFMFHYPEFLITQIGLIIVIAEFFDLRLLQFLNPAVSGVSMEDGDDMTNRPSPSPKPATDSEKEKVNLAA